MYLVSTAPTTAAERQSLPSAQPGTRWMTQANRAEDPLLPNVARGDELAARRCIERYAPLVGSMARRFFGSHADADDAVQDIFLELWRCAGRFDPKTASEAAFVVMIARRRLIDRARSVKRARAHVDLAELQLLAVEGDAERDADARRAAQVLSDVGDAPRNALILSVVHGLAHQEIAEALDLPLGSVKSHIRRTLQLLRRSLLGEEETTP